VAADARWRAEVDEASSRGTSARAFSSGLREAAGIGGGIAKSGDGSAVEAWRKKTSLLRTRSRLCDRDDLDLKTIGGPPGDANAEQMDTLADLATNIRSAKISVGNEQEPLELPPVARRDLRLWEGARQGRAGDAERQPGVRHHACPGWITARSQTALDPIAQG